MTKDELLSCLTDRPCSACKFHTDRGCCKWSCVFEDKTEEWIPCEERLPSEDGRYLVTIWDSGINDFPLIRMYSYAKNLKAVDKYDFPKKINGWFGYDGEFGYYEVPDVVAWMPLPEPYKGGEK